MTTANINTTMLTWARKRTGIAVSDFARKCGVSVDKLNEWESGRRPLTFKQALTYAEKAHIPFGYLFLIQPPVEELPIPDLRTVEGPSATSTAKFDPVIYRWSPEFASERPLHSL